MTIVTDELTQIHHLYTLQYELFTILEVDQLDANSLKIAKQNLRNFSSLLKSVSSVHMGGEDVYDGLVEFRTKVNARLKNIALQKKKKR